MMRIRAAQPNDATMCEQILRSVPDWFGIEESLLQYVADCARYPTFLAEIDGAAAGFVTLHRHFAESAEIHCIAVRREHHRRGIGRAMIEHAEGLCRRDGVRFLQVKSQGPSRPCEHYELTRKFYLGMGFVPLEELIGYWGRNPCLIMIKSL
ncbi:MAG: GNAT family N-acetyltransferase [Phycisphaerae bacterium]